MTVNSSTTQAHPSSPTVPAPTPDPSPIEVAAKQTVAVAALVAIAVVWGVAFSVVKEVVASVPPATLVMWRFLVATLTLLILRPRCLTRVSSATWRRGAVLGCLLGTGFLVHTLGLQETSVVSSAFITGTVVIFAPLVARIFLGRSINRRTVTAIALATAGLAAITLHPTTASSGDLLIVAAAVLWAFHLVGLEMWTESKDVYALAVIQLGVVSVLAAAVQIVTGGHISIPAHLSTMCALIGLGSVATGGAFLLLAWTQTRVNATTAAILLTLEPVFGALTAIGLGEDLSLNVAAGGASAILAAALVIKP
jgi:drug/metabolite transporter (DMT)-like permease